MMAFRKKNNENQRVLEKVIVSDKYIQSNLSILILGETGTGKTSLAKLIHHKSKRIGDFVHLNISSFSKELIESELFGIERSFYRGA